MLGAVRGVALVEHPPPQHVDGQEIAAVEGGEGDLHVRRDRRVVATGGQNGGQEPCGDIEGVPAGPAGEHQRSHSGAPTRSTASGRGNCPMMLLVTPPSTRRFWPVT